MANRKLWPEEAYKAECNRCGYKVFCYRPERQRTVHTRVISGPNAGLESSYMQQEPGELAPVIDNCGCS